MKISKAQYEKAKKIVLEYESNNVSAFNKTFTIDDLDVLNYSISVPSIKDSDISDGELSLLEELISNEISVDYTNSDDSGHLTISFRESLLTDKHINVTLNALNNMIKIQHNNYYGKR